MTTFPANNKPTSGPPTGGPGVAVITPCHNSEKTIRDTLDSVLAQSYTNWQMIVVDDNSNDRSLDIVKEYVSKDPRIRLMSKASSSGTPADPRNDAIDSLDADTKYVAFLDSDDIWLPDKLERQIAYMESTGCAMTYAYYEKIDTAGTRKDRVVRTRRYTDYPRLLTTNSIPLLTAVLRRDIIGDTRFLRIAQEDFNFWLDILKKGVVAENIREVVALYRYRSDSRSVNKFRMFVGFWNVIRHQQRIGLLRSIGCMVTYTVNGFIKLLK